MAQPNDKIKMNDSTETAIKMIDSTKTAIKMNDSTETAIKMNDSTTTAIKKIEINDSTATIYYHHSTVSENWSNVQQEIYNLKQQGYIEIQRGNTLVLLPNREFPSDIQDLKTLPRDVEDLGWNVLETFSHVTKFTKDLLLKDHSTKEEFQIVQRFTIES